MSYEHNRQCPLRVFGRGHTDAAKRVADAWNLHRIGDVHGSVGKWIACRLDDGTSDNVLYESKVTAVKHQRHNEQYYAFLRIIPFTITYCEAEVYLIGARKVYDAGMRMTDPDHRHGGPDIIKRSTWEDETAKSLFLVNQNLLLPHELN